MKKLQIALLALGIGLPLGLYLARFCFSSLRFVSEHEICEKMLQSLGDQRRPTDSCEVHWNGAYFGAMGFTKSGEWSEYFDRCGNSIKMH